MNLGAILLDLVAQVLSNPIVVGSAMVMGVALVAGWLLAIVWAFQNVAHRSDSILARYLAATWVLLSGPILLPLSLAILGCLRPVETAADGRLKRLALALQARLDGSPCVACGAGLDARWVRCPWCGEWQGQQCRRCEKWAPADADICPWCTWSPGEPLVQPQIPVALPTRTDEPAAVALPGLEGAAPGAGVAAATSAGVAAATSAGVAAAAARSA
jgi:hypothetical protein